MEIYGPQDWIWSCESWKGRKHKQVIEADDWCAIK